MHIYEINTWPWLQGLSAKYGRPITLQNVPADEIRALSNLQQDMIWLMGVWERSPKGRRVAAEHRDLQLEYQEALRDFRSKDVVGSPYSVHRYVVDEILGGPAGLATFRQQLRQYGLRLMLDYVPNHVAIDHPWTHELSDALVGGTPDEQADDPQSFFPIGDRVFAHGRDPYFPAWTDTAQLNAFSDAYRQASIDALSEIAAQCDGVRCDMAMLLTNHVFSKTWSLKRVGPIPKTEYWQSVIPAIHAQYPEFIFIAEVYWSMEHELQQQGFDYCYDKRLYDRMVHEDAARIINHLKAHFTYQSGLVRFSENHDERRAMDTMGIGRSRMAAVLIATLPGAKLWHEGQFHGHRVKLPAQLGRRPKERDNAELYSFYRRLLGIARDGGYQQGDWRLREVIRAWPGNESNQHLVAYTWRNGDERRLIVVNYSDHRSQGRVVLSNFEVEGLTWHLNDLLDKSVYDRHGDPMAHDGLYIDLQPWTAHIFDFALKES